jgi:NhaP-type Na+/H+ and K+/H+ antiporter
MFEHHHEPLLSRRAFLKRVARYALISLGLLLVSLLIGMVGYYTLEGFSWVDAFLNAAMLMGGMGPVGTLHTDAGKVFAGIYAMYCGLVELVAVGIFAAPIFHRFLHHFHLEKQQ